ncbi:uncharacterized protein B0P05DRAFT_541372 [Gilbertella persicaria]|uniref:uncharacterized protein n=1 Tax=Gilbertella persicaria TaxID=101096 RepID=UPI00221EBFF6|nr:uncharacterized protein B0P05DRAFT_541372 [Gilbertella persicaria]KAI8079627.1 hypothetical protein B0P05DRAFT_541372 [Gilbertella persicaria]
MDAPWSNKETLKKSNKLERLSNEIKDFESYIAPTKKEQLNRDTLLYSITQLVDSLWPGNTVTPFGSSVTGLQFPASDIDLNVNFEVLPKNNPIDVLKVIRKQAVSRHILPNYSTRLVANAKVPVLMATDENQVSIDITVQNECFSSDRTAVWLKEYPMLKPLFMVLKLSIANYRISSLPTFEPMSAKTAGLASYSLICMIVSYIQLQASSQHPSDPEYYANLLLGFLDFYTEFENTRQAISLEGKGAYLAKNQTDIKIDTKPGRLTIIDPDVSNANVARSTFRFDTLKTIFAKARDDLRKRISNSTKGESILSSILQVQSHYFGEPRSEGARFRVRQIWINTGEAPVKFPRKRFNQAYRPNLHVAGHRYEDERKPYRGERRYNPYNNNNNSPQRSYNNSREESYDREYQRHKKNNNSHLAQHYKNKADRAKRR